MIRLEQKIIVGKSKIIAIVLLSFNLSASVSKKSSILMQQNF